MDSSVVVVTYNSAKQITACLNSLPRQTDVESEILVVDNASTDDTLAQVKNFNVRLIPSNKNLGFGSGCNLGAKAGTGKYVYLLNPDACLNDRKSLSKICQIMNAHPGWGMAGTKVLSPDGNEESRPALSYPGQRFVPRDFSKLPGEIAWIIGASMVIRRELYETLNGFDSQFFLYSEETDFCLRLRELGHQIGHIGEVAVKHVGGASETQSDPYDVAMRKLKGLILFRQKHYASENCVFLAKRDWRRARFRALWNGWLTRLQPARSKAWKKSRNYQAICALRKFPRQIRKLIFTSVRLSRPTARNWPPAQLKELISVLTQKFPQKKIVLSCAPTEREQTKMKALLALLPQSPWRVHAGNLTLTQLAAVIQHSAVHFCGDTGTLHLAAMTNTPTLAWFWPNPGLEQWMPSGPQYHVNIGKNKPNSPYLMEIKTEDLVQAAETCWLRSEQAPILHRSHPVHEFAIPITCFRLSDSRQ